MTIDRNKRVVRRLWEEVWNKNMLNVCDVILNEKYAKHESKFVSLVRAAFPDLYIRVEDMVSEGDKVVSRYIFTGTQQSEIWGIPDTGKTVEIQGIWIHRLANNRIVEGYKWGVMDLYEMMKQLRAL